MINMDAPKHTKLRLIVNRGFTPRQVAKIEDIVRDQAREIVDRVVDRCGECDFVSEIAAALPLQIICDMMGIPREDNKRIFELTEHHPRRRRPRVRADDGRAHGRGHGAVPVRPRARARTALDNPRDDITTTLMQAEVEDENGRHKLTPGELGSFFLLLVVAGNETTRNAISHGMHALTDHPDQRADLDRRLRRRLADRGRGDRAVGDAGHQLPPHRDARRRGRRPGDQGRREGRDVLQLGQPRRARSSTTRSASTSLRTPNEHVGFGAGGPHFCLGANLARREIKVMFEELFRRLPDIEITGEPDCCRAASSTASSACRAPGTPSPADPGSSPCGPCPVGRRTHRRLCDRAEPRGLRVLVELRNGQRDFTLVDHDRHDRRRGDRARPRRSLQGRTRDAHGRVTEREAPPHRRRLVPRGSEREQQGHPLLGIGPPVVVLRVEAGARTGTGLEGCTLPPRRVLARQRRAAVHRDVLHREAREPRVRGRVGRPHGRHRARPARRASVRFQRRTQSHRGPGRRRSAHGRLGARTVAPLGGPPLRRGRSQPHRRDRAFVRRADRLRRRRRRHGCPRSRPDPSRRGASRPSWRWTRPRAS